MKESGLNCGSASDVASCKFAASAIANEGSGTCVAATQTRDPN